MWFPCDRQDDAYQTLVANRDNLQDFKFDFLQGVLTKITESSDLSRLSKWNNEALRAVIFGGLFVFAITLVVRAHYVSWRFFAIKLQTSGADGLLQQGTVHPQ